MHPDMRAYLLECVANLEQWMRETTDNATYWRHHADWVRLTEKLTREIPA